MAVESRPAPETPQRASAAGWRARALASLGAATAAMGPRVAAVMAALDRRLDPVFSPLNRMRKRAGAAIDAWLPKRMFARSMLMIVVPMVLLQAVVTLVFMERHWNAVTQKLSDGVVRDVAALIDVLETVPGASSDDIERLGSDRFGLNVAVLPAGPLPPPARKPWFDLLDASLARAIGREIGRPFWVDTAGDSDRVRIIVKLEDANLRVFAPRSRAYAKNSHIFLVWMAGSAVLLIGVALLFLRGQVRPIQQLADAAESFGMGRPTPPGFRPRGATEVRRAGLAFIRMRERIERQIEQRTKMLTGVSHDLRTILTRFRLQLAVASRDELDPELGAELRRDLDDMQSMLGAYLDFARGEGEEDIGLLSLEQLVARCKAEADAHGVSYSSSIEGEDGVAVRPVAFTRLVMNLVTNACRHAATVRLSARHGGGWLTLDVEDDGPGIPEDRREEAMKPFVRLNADASSDDARNQDVGGTGLGLTIARDIARSHGGELTLGRSDLGGLKGSVRVPA